MKKKNILVIVGIVFVVIVIVMAFYLLKEEKDPLEGQIIDPGAIVVPDFSDISSATNSLAVIKTGEIPVETPEAIELKIINGIFSPSEFNVEKGSMLTLLLEGDKEVDHAVLFDDLGLAANPFLMIKANEKQLITFPAPLNPGEYRFRCTIPGHESEFGTMIVK